MPSVVQLGVRIPILSSVLSHASSQHHLIFLDITTANAPNPEVGPLRRHMETRAPVALQSPDVLAHAIHSLGLMLV